VTRRRGTAPAGAIAALVAIAIAACCAGAALRAAGGQGAADTQYAPVNPGQPLVFPADYGSHPRFRTEWWYVTGWLQTADGAPLGFQITFFRTRPDIWRQNPSAFTPRQVLIAHCAISDPRRGRLWHAERIERAGFGLAGADSGDTRVWIGGWSLVRSAGTYRSRAAGARFSFDLEFSPTQPPMLNGAGGYSRKGPDASAASYYYSIPHLRVSGRVTRAGRSDAVTGEGWLDHEWSSAYLDRHAVGWDWIGMNLDDGGALMAFRIRGADGGALWAGGSVRGADGRVQILAPQDVAFTPLRTWVSPRTAIRYPVRWQIRAGGLNFELRPLLDDQENDARATSGAIYWEGAVSAYQRRRRIGQGYLEMTGYGGKMQLP